MKLFAFISFTLFLQFFLIDPIYCREQLQTSNIQRKEKISEDIAFSGSFSGKTEDTLTVYFRLSIADNEVTGFYFYEKTGADIRLIGTRTGSRFELYELNYDGNKTAEIKGVWSDSRFVGTWAEQATKRAYSVILNRTSEMIDPLPKDIAGFYAVEQDSEAETCKKFNIRIVREKDNYGYMINTCDRTEKGPIRFFRGEKELYVIFENFRWAEYAGDLNVENEEDIDWNREVYGFDAEWDAGRLSFQNYGNSMNYYTIIEGCGGKFIELYRVSE